MASWSDIFAPRYWLALFLSAVLFWFGTGLEPLWPLTWLAPVPILLVALRYRAWQTGFAAFIAVLIGSFNLWHYLHDLLGLPVIALVMKGSASAIVFAAAVLIFRWLFQRGAVFGGIVALAAICVSFEFLVNLTSSVGTATSLAYSQLNFLPFLQLASITGPWGMSFLLYAIPAAAVSAFALFRESRKQSIQVIRVFGTAMVVVLAFGLIRLNTSIEGEKVKVGLIASDAPGNDGVAQAGGPTQKLLQAYAAQTFNLIAGGANVIVLPEKIGVSADDDIPASDNILRDTADRTGVPIVAGLVTAAQGKITEGSSGTQYNAARVYIPHAARLEYHKEHMLPQFESKYTPGTELTMLHTNWGVAICKDMDFTDLSLRYGRAGVGLLLVPGWDFDVDWSFHGHIAIMRAVENGFSLVRAAKNGSLFAADNRGRVVAELRTNRSPFVSLIAEVPTTHSPTIYQQLGDWFAYFSVVLLVGSFAQIWFLRRRTAGQKNSALQNHFSGNPQA